MEFDEFDELEKFCNYAKVANPPYNPAKLLLCLAKQIRLLSLRISELEYKEEIDENYED